MKKLLVLSLVSLAAFAVQAQAPAAPAKVKPACAAGHGAEAHFTAVDTNKDGFVDKAEATASKGCGFLGYLNKNKQDKVDKATWIKMGEDAKAANKAKMDTNKDGKVSKEERAAAKK